VLCLVGRVDRLCDDAGDDDDHEESWNVVGKSRRMVELENRIVDQDCLIDQYRAALGDRGIEIDNLKLVSILLIQIWNRQLSSLDLISHLKA